MMNLRNMEQKSITDVINRIKRGDEKAFSTLFHSQYAKLFRIALLLIKDSDAANDIVQELFITIWKRKEQLGDPMTVERYLIVSVKHNSLRYNQTKQRECALTDCVKELPYEETRTMTKAQTTQLLNAVDALPARCRELFKLAIFSELTYNEVAEISGVSINTVKTQIKLGYSKLRKQLNVNSFIYLLLFKRNSIKY